MFLSFTHKNISGDSTTASVHSVTADESDSGPTAANYDAYQHLHTHTYTHAYQHTLAARKPHAQCLHKSWLCKANANDTLSYIKMHKQK